jgi:hypothetical protein
MNQAKTRLVHDQLNVLMKMEIAAEEIHTPKETCAFLKDWMRVLSMTLIYEKCFLGSEVPVHKVELDLLETLRTVTALCGCNLGDKRIVISPHQTPIRIHADPQLTEEGLDLLIHSLIPNADSLSIRFGKKNLLILDFQNLDFDPLFQEPPLSEVSFKNKTSSEILCRLGYELLRVQGVDIKIHRNEFRLTFPVVQ